MKRTRQAAGWVTCALILLVAGTLWSADYYPPPEWQGGWRTLVPLNAVPTQEQLSDIADLPGLNWNKLNEAWNYVETVGTCNSLLIIRHGWIAAEWNTGYEAAVGSGSKSFNGLALAKVMEMSDAGELPQRIGLDDFAYQFLPPSFSA